MKSSRALLSVIVAATLMMPIVPQSALADEEGDAGTAEEQDGTSAADSGSDDTGDDTGTDASGGDESGGDTGGESGDDTSGESGDEQGSESTEDPTDDPSSSPDPSSDPSPSPSSDPSPSSESSDPSAQASSDNADAGANEESEEEGDRTADVESAADWQAMADALEFTGQWAHDLLLMAESQLGYNESEKNFIYEDGDKSQKQGYTRYGDWYGDNDGALYGEWCAMFVSFCLHYAGVQNTYYGDNCASWVARIQEADAQDEAAAEQAGTEFAAADHRYQSAEDYIPQAGDIVFFDKGTGTACHVGIVKCLNYDSEHGVHPTGFTTIEGNNGPVGYHTYALGGDGEVLGFMRLPENPDYRTVQCGETPLYVTAEIPQDVVFTAQTAQTAEDEESADENAESTDANAAEDGAQADANEMPAAETMAAAIAVPEEWELITLVEVDSTAGDEAWDPSRPAVASFVRTGTSRMRAAAKVAEDGTLEILGRESVSSTVSFDYRGRGSYALLAKKNTGIAEQIRIANETKAALITDKDESDIGNIALNTVRAHRARALSFSERVEADKLPDGVPMTEYQRELYKQQVIK